MLTSQLEPWASFWADAKPLVHQHWQEIAVDQDCIQVSFDNAKYEAMDANGILHTFVIRLDGRVIGYYIAFVLPHLHYMDAGLMAFTDIYYLLPEHREGLLGIEMFIQAEKSLAAKGVRKAYLSHKAHKNNGPIFERLGWKLTDLSYTKMLESVTS